MEEIKKQENANDHLANEPTFLAWIRTSIGIMAFGFVVVKIFAVCKANLHVAWKACHCRTSRLFSN
jgi:uncharacterized membrane protein YidH (DUF202 family)